MKPGYKNVFICMICCLVNTTLDAIQGFVSTESSLRKIIQFFNFNLVQRQAKKLQLENKVHVLENFNLLFLLHWAIIQVKC